MRVWKIFARVVLVAAGLALGGAAAVSLTSLASGNGQDTEPRRIPYTGILAQAGQPFTGSVDLRFTLVSDGQRDEWTELHQDVSVAAGRFGVVLGEPGGEVPDWAFDATSVHLRIEVREGGGPWRRFGGEQRIHPAMASYWTAEADNLSPDGHVSVAGDLVLQGTSARAESLVVQNSFLVPGKLRPTSGADGGLTFQPGVAPGATAAVKFVRDNRGDWLEFQVDGEDSQIVLEAGGTALEVGQDVIALHGGAVVPAGQTSALDGARDVARYNVPIRLFDTVTAEPHRRDGCLSENGCNKPAVCALTQADLAPRRNMDPSLGTARCAAEMGGSNFCPLSRVATGIPFRGIIDPSARCSTRCMY